MLEVQHSVAIIQSILKQYLDERGEWNQPQ